MKHFLPQLGNAIESLVGITADVLVIDDGSTDDTVEVVQSSGYDLISNSQNKGLGFTLRRGYQHCVDNSYDFLVSMDSDGQHEVSFLPVVLERLILGDEFIIASRYHPESERIGPPIDRDLLNITFTSIIHSLTGWQQITDPLSGFCGMNLRIASFLAENIKLDRYGSCLELLLKLFYLCRPRPDIVEIPHPAIYSNHDGGILNREYSPGTRDDRLERFRDHALHVCMVIEELKAAGFGDEIDQAIQAWRHKQQLISTQVV